MTVSFSTVLLGSLLACVLFAASVLILTHSHLGEWDHQGAFLDARRELRLMAISVVSAGSGKDDEEQLEADTGHTRLVRLRAIGQQPSTPGFVYHRFPDANGDLATPLPRASVQPPTDAGPNPDASAQPVRQHKSEPAVTADQSAVPASGASVLPAMSAERREQMLSEARALSLDAHQKALRHSPAAAFDPPGGPMASVVPADGELLSSTSMEGKYHVVVTGDHGLYGRWQTLVRRKVNYHTYLKVKRRDAASPLGGYTRVLHAGAPDDIMHLVPTVLVDRLPAGIDRGYGPMNRPWALAQWLTRARNVPEAFILMTEPDHVFLAAPPLAASAAEPAAAPFWYVDCRLGNARAHCLNATLNERHVPLEKVQSIGNSPTLIAKAQLAEMLPRWDRLVRAIHADPAADRDLGWAQEMFAFALALANAPAGPPRVRLRPEWMVQPPFQQSLARAACETRWRSDCPSDSTNRGTVNASIIHFTYGQDHDRAGKSTYGRMGEWHWDKRDWHRAYPPLPIPRPPAGTGEATVRLIEEVEEAGLSAGLRDWWAANVKPPE